MGAAWEWHQCGVGVAWVQSGSSVKAVRELFGSDFEWHSVNG